MEVLGIHCYANMIFGPKEDRRVLLGVWPNEGYAPNDVTVIASKDGLAGAMTKEKFKQLYDAGKAG